MSVIDLLLATLFAVLAVSIAALLGDRLLAAVARRSGRRPSPRSVTVLLTLAGAPPRP